MCEITANIEHYRNFLKQNGYVHIKNFFSDSEIEILRNYLECKEKNNEKSEIHDLLSINEINEVFLSKKYLSLISALFKEKIYYFGASTMRFHQEDIDIFHVDSRDDLDLNCDDEYPIYRMGIYLQDHDKWSGGLKIRNKSHKKLYVRFYPFYHSILTIKKLLKNKLNIFDIFFSGKILNIKSKKNDLIIWNMRTHHSGRFRILKILPNLSIHPFFERYLPNFLFCGYQKKRYAAYLAFGKSSVFLDKYVNEYKQRFPLVLKNLKEKSKLYSNKLSNYGIYIK
jgi:hypothetical protein